MNIKNIKLPIIIIVVGMLVAAASCFLVGIRKEPVIKERDFDYSVTYRLDGEEKTLEGIFKCKFSRGNEFTDPTSRDYVGEYIQNGNELNSYYTTIAQKDGVELFIVAELDADYLMGDPEDGEYNLGNNDPYLEAVDSEGIAVEVSDTFDAEIISFEYPEPIENSFQFAGFSVLYANSMFSMLLVAILTIIACMIFVRRNADVSYKILDKLSIAFNFILLFAVIPFITVAVFLFPLVMDEKTLLYQIYLCIPALTAFTIAASVVLRRKGFSKSGMIVQFVFPVLWILQILLESLFTNLFM